MELIFFHSKAFPEHIMGIDLIQSYTMIMV